MPNLRAEEDDADDLRDALEPHPQLSHLRVRRRANTLLLESGPKDDPIRHARFRRMTAGIWELDAATHKGAEHDKAHTLHMVVARIEADGVITEKELDDLHAVIMSDGKLGSEEQAVLQRIVDKLRAGKLKRG